MKVQGHSSRRLQLSGNFVGRISYGDIEDWPSMNFFLQFQIHQIKLKGWQIKLMTDMPN